MDADEHVAHRNADIAEHGAVRQVALQTADGQLLTQVRQNSVGDAQVALRVLEIDGIHLVRHCAGTYLASLYLLAEILSRDILPEVAVQVDDDSIDALHCIEQSSEAVVVADLRRIFLALQSETLGNKATAKVAPIILRISHMMGIEVACRSTELSCNGTSTKHVQLTLQAIDKDHHLLAQTCGTGRLTVSLRQHGNILPLVGILTQLCDKLLDEGVIDLLQSLLDAQGHAGVVDILAGQAEVDEFLVVFQSADAVELFLDEVLDSLHIVVCNSLYILHALGILFREVAVYVAQLLVADGKALQLRQGQMNEGNKIFYLYPDTIANQSIFREIRSQRFGLASVSAVNRRYSSQHI